MGSVYRRGDSSKWWIAYADAEGKRRLQSTGFTDKRLAEQTLETIEGMVRRRETVKARPSTVAAWAEKWAQAREGVNWTADQDFGRIKKHVLPRLGAELLVDVTQGRVRELVHAWRDGGKMAPRTIRNVFWAMSRMFRDAVATSPQLITVSPCNLLPGDRPSIKDKDRSWRKTAIFTRAEVDGLCWDPKLPADHRVLWALGLFGGLRLGEVAALRWRDLDTARKPLACLSVSSSYTRLNGEEKGTKTEVVREVPVHPALAEALKQWREVGWPEVFGREPVDDDLVLPNRAHRFLNDQNVTDARKVDFKRLGLRWRRFHDARRTMISLTLADGAMPHILKLVTHGAPSTVMDLYTTLPWTTLCAAVGCRTAQPPPLTSATATSPATVTTSTDSTTDSDNRISLAQEGIRTHAVSRLAAGLVSTSAGNATSNQSAIEVGSEDRSDVADGGGAEEPPSRSTTLRARLRALTLKTWPKRAWRRPAIRTVRGAEFLDLLARGGR